MVKANWNSGFDRQMLAPNLGRSFERYSKMQGMCSKIEGIDRGELSRMRRLLQCRLFWYGFQSVKIGTIRGLTEDTILVDLLKACGVVVCQVEIDRESGAIRPWAARALSRLPNLTEVADSDLMKDSALSN
jgi:hypothetical protein